MSATPRCRPPATRTSSSGWPAASSPRRWTAAGPCGSCGWSRACPMTASRCSQRPITRSSTGSPGVDIATVLFDTSAEPMPTPEPEQEWIARPVPSSAQLLADALIERATVPAEIARGVRATLRGPRHVAGRVGAALAGVGAIARAGLQVAPPSAFNVRIGPHRRFTWVRGDLPEFKMIKNALGGTVNDVVLDRRGRRPGPLPADARRVHRGPRAARDGSGVGPCRRRTRSARQQGRRHVGAAAGRAPRSRAAAADDQPGDGRDQGVQSGRRRSGAHRADRLRAADDHGPGRAAAGPPAALQPRRHQRARARSSRSTCSRAGWRRCTRWCRWPRIRLSGSRS